MKLKVENYLNLSSLDEIKENVIYLSERTKSPEMFNGRKGYFANRLNRLLLFQAFNSTKRYGTLECVDGSYKNLDTNKIYKYFIPEI